MCKNNKMKMAYEFEKEEYNMDLGQEREGGMISTIISKLKVIIKK